MVVMECHLLEFTCMLVNITVHQVQFINDLLLFGRQVFGPVRPDLGIPEEEETHRDGENKTRKSQEAR
jgi:hypothetical protein